MLSEHILNDSTCSPVQDRYLYWSSLIEQNVEFWLPDSTIHTKLHCTRVLLLALTIGYHIGVNGDDLDALAMAAVFHDSRRKDDKLGTGHGKRAADYYVAYCQEYNLPYDSRTYFIMAFHDQDDKKGITDIEKNEVTLPKGILLYQIFKDSDGLDRFRLGQEACNVNMFRMLAAQNLITFAKDLLQKSQKVI